VRILDHTLLLSISIDITERKRIEDEWTRRAYLDDLTDLPNGLFMQEHVEDVIRRVGAGGRFALALIDLDNFKHINDYYSHAIGDALLVRAAERIARRLCESDLLARISGDEFLLLLDPLEDIDKVRAPIRNILQDLKQPFHIDTFEIFTAASVGVSVYPEHGRDYEALRRNADSAMYRVKSGTKGEMRFFDVEMGVR
jgi:diguanylate cyclase (GGDEF)-like protein